MTQRRPTTAAHPQARVMRLRLYLPASAFDPFAVDVTVPESAVECIAEAGEA